MVDNLRLITEALGARKEQPPAEALHYASQQLKAQGHGGTSRYYVRGLDQAASKLEGHAAVDGDDVLQLVQTLMSAIPSEGQSEQPQAGGNVLDVLGHLGQQPDQPEDDGLDVGDVLEKLLPAGLAFLQAKQSGADTKTAATQAVVSTLMGGRANPLQAGTPRAAAGGIVAQGLLRALSGK